MDNRIEVPEQEINSACEGEQITRIALLQTDQDTLPHGLERFRFIGLHGFSDNRKANIWNLLNRIKGSSTLPRLIDRDFNEILTHNEKKEGI
ncbi:hypothetical protein V6N13_072259 [Hibiscus sabdariffa]